MSAAGEGDMLSFARDIKPLFRAKDRDSMLAAFDLFDYSNVARHADAIVGALAKREDAMRRRVACVPGRDASALD